MSDSPGTLFKSDPSPSGGGFTNPMNSSGDLIYGVTFGAAARLANGSSLQVLTSQGSNAPLWALPSYVNSGNWATLPITTAGFGTITSAAFFGRRQGDSLEVRATWTNGTVGASTAIIQLPQTGTTLIIDTTKLPTNAAGTYVGLCFGGGNTNVFSAANGIIFFDGSITSQLFLSGLVGTVSFTKENANSISNSNDFESVHFSIPILGWSYNN